MSILSVVAVSRLAERSVREAGGQLDRGDLLARLGGYDIDTERAAAGLRLALICGRLEAISAPESALGRP